MSSGYLQPYKVVLEGIIFAVNKEDLRQTIKEISAGLGFGRLKIVAAEKEQTK